ncbi:hypothetical protein [Maize bushy stunt phytoplasma]|uniref:hypothetical protein n=1 Tax=Maize bushy stunt phytoplasma TaxID=202462 RepID=UPI00083CFF83|nr:hypothetical protein [Maize bushy stunt phytoplasma]
MLNKVKSIGNITHDLEKQYINSEGASGSLGFENKELQHEIKKTKRAIENRKTCPQSNEKAIR